MLWVCTCAVWAARRALRPVLLQVIFAYLVQDVLLLSFSVLASKQSADAGPTCQAYIFFTVRAQCSVLQVHDAEAACACRTWLTRS